MVSSSGSSAYQTGKEFQLYSFDSGKIFDCAEETKRFGYFVVWWKVCLLLGWRR